MQYKLSEIINIIGGGTPKTSNADYWGGKIPWLSVVDFNNDNRYVYETEKTITEEGLKNSSTKILPQGALILSARGTVGALAQLAKPMAFNQSCYGIIAKKGTTNDFLYYLIKHIVGDLQARGHGSVFNTITRDTFETINITLPPLEEQKRIAEVLGAFDDKIELLQKQNKTLEEMAKAIFKSWFVDFDIVKAKQKGEKKEDIIKNYHLTEELYNLFPSSFVDSSLGPIPTGWEVKKIGELVSVVRGGSPRPIQKFLSKEGLPWLKISDATASPTKFITHIEQCIIPEGLSKTRLIKSGSLVVSNSATPGMPKFLALDTCIHDGWLFLDDYKGITKELLYYFVLFNRTRLVALGSGSVFTNLKTDVLKNFQIIVPTETIQNKLNSIFTQIDEGIYLNNKQIQTLTELRDTLLPRLISGKIKV